MKPLFFCFAALPVFLISTNAAKAAPVLYTFQLDNSSGTREFNFQFTAPSYLNAGTTYIFNANQLSNVYTNTGTTDGGVINSILLNEDIVNQSGQAYPVNYLSLNLVRTNDNPSTVNISFGRGPGQPGVYLDRDGSYALPSSNFSASAYYFGGLLSVSVAAQPTTSPEPASMWLAGLALSSGVALRLRSVKRRK